MDTFLRQVAQDLYSRYAEDMSQLTIVFPNKRASIFFNQHLSELMGSTPILAPRYTTISELFERLSQKSPADKILLICHLYQSYIEVTGRADETLDHFFSWGEVMLSDFDDIDKNLVDSRLLMSNIADLEHLTDLSYLSEEQVEAIHTFFHNANLEQKSRLKDEFLTLWDMLHAIYTHFKARLETHHIAYEGMLQREVTELLLQPGKDGHGEWPDALSPMLRRHYAFVGFNVLNQTEHHLFRYLKSHATTFFYWDYDKAYMQDFSRMAVADGKSGKPDHLHEAGRFIHDNILRYGNSLRNPSTFDNMGKRLKRIRFIASSTENAQAREVTDWLTNRQAADAPFNPREHAIVLCNEGLLEPVLHSIPSGPATPPLNVTMGYPLNETALSSFINMVLDMQSQCAGRRDWRFRPVANVLRHPLTRRLCGPTSDTIISQLLKGNIMFPTADMLQKDEFTTLLFAHPKDKNGLLDYLTALIEHISLAVNQSNTSQWAFEEQLNQESFFVGHRIINRLRTIMETGLLNVQTDTLARLIRQLFSVQSIPFHGEPAQGVQILGLLETRNLDFRHLLILSANEGNLPKPDHITSLIPYNLREAYGMTNMEKRNSLYAYYFFRLIQRAETVTITYNSSTDRKGTGEMSRFMNQMLVDSDLLFAPGQTIEREVLNAKNAEIIADMMLVERTEEMGERLQVRYNLRREADYRRARGNDKSIQYLSPSALNQFMDCRLKFFFQYVAGFKTDDDVTEEVDDNQFGTLFHYCMEQLYRPLTGREVESHVLRGYTNDKAMLMRLIDKAFEECFFKDHQHHRYNGEQLLNKHVLYRYVRKQLEYDARLCPMTILGVETRHEAIINIESSRYGVFPIRLGGIIDRMDIITLPDGQRVKRIVDYKTNQSTQEAKSVESLFDPSNKKSTKNIMQTFYYADVVCMNDDKDLKETLPVAPALMYIKASDEKNPPCLMLDKQEISDFNATVRQEYHERLMQTITEMFDAEHYTQRPDEKSCQYCDFKEYCRRGMDEKSW